MEAALALQQETLSHLWTQPAPSEKAAASGARAFVLEAKTDARRGRCLQVVVRSGWLKEGAWVCLGQHAVKLKRIWKAEDTEQGERWMSVKLAGPSEIVEISGFGNIVSDAASLVGQLVMQVKNPQQALKLATMARRAAEVSPEGQHKTDCRTRGSFSDETVKASFLSGFSQSPFVKRRRVMKVAFCEKVFK